MRDKRVSNRRRKNKRKRRKQLFRRIVVCIIAVLLVLMAAVEIRKWQDSGGTEGNVIKRNIPLLFQYDSDWAEENYGDSDMKTAGCAPTCLAMVIRGLTNNDVTPLDVARFAEENGYYADGVGTQWTLMTEGSRSFDVKGKEIALDETVVMKHLRKGRPIICSVGPGDFTKEGHFIVLAGVQEGKIIVNDPNSKKRSNRLWTYENIEGQIKNLWVFQKR